MGMMTEGGAVRSNTLCWKCWKATDENLCPWVKDGTPVEGWAAIPDKHPSFDSYLVLRCPNFAPDAQGLKRTSNDLSEGTVNRLIEDIVKQAITDWKWADKVEKGQRKHFKNQRLPSTVKDDVETFFRGEWFATLCDVDGNKILEMLKKGEL